MAGFEVADQDPTPLFESSSLRGIFDVWSTPASVRLICNRIVPAHVVPDGVEQVPPPLEDTREASAA